MADGPLRLRLVLDGSGGGDHGGGPGAAGSALASLVIGLMAGVTAPLVMHAAVGLAVASNLMPGIGAMARLWARRRVAWLRAGGISPAA